MKYYKLFIGALVLVLVFLFGIYVGERDYSDFNFKWYREANATKYDLIENMEGERYLFYKLIYEDEMDSGKYDDLIDDLENLGLGELRHNIDSIYDANM